MSLDALNEIAWREMLTDHLGKCAFGVRIRCRGEQQDGDMRRAGVGAQLLPQLVPVHARKHEVGGNQVRDGTPRKGKRLGAIACTQHGQPTALEYEAEEPSDSGSSSTTSTVGVRRALDAAGAASDSRSEGRS